MASLLLIAELLVWLALGHATKTTAIQTAVGILEVTPAQTAGPFYPLVKPDDRDNDLTIVADAAGVAEGNVLQLNGILLWEEGGTPVAGATVEIWQADNRGIYMHPNALGAEGRDPNFQSYGETTTDADGLLGFRTVIPAQYSSRPRHIHVKVLVGGIERLTTQIYFRGDPNLATDAVFKSTGSSGQLLLIDPIDCKGGNVLAADHTIVLQGGGV
ncbi:unnamed protein product [Discosporangium mesarthrocarpum]